MLFCTGWHCLRRKKRMLPQEFLHQHYPPQMINFYEKKKQTQHKKKMENKN